MAESLTVTRNDAASRYEARLADTVVTVIDFLRRDNLLIVTHTGTDPRWRGRGFAGQATQAALDDIRGRGEIVRPVCPFTIQFFIDHPEYADLVE